MRIRKNPQLEKEDVVLIAKASDALAHPVRVELFRYIYLENLNRRTVCNKDLVEAFNYSQPKTSIHKTLRRKLPVPFANKIFLPIGQIIRDVNLKH